jgi:hypothetical protein
MKLDTLLERVTSDGHIPCGLFVFVVGSVIHWFHGLDASYVAFSSTVLTFLGAHAYVQGKFPDDHEEPK